MDKDIIELLPRTKEEVDEALEAKVVLDAVDAGIISKEFIDIINKDLGIKDNA